MNIQINDKWRIASDQNQWMVQKHTPRKDGRSGDWTAVSYHATVAQACESLAHLQIRMHEGEGIAELWDITNKVVAEIMAATEPLRELESMATFEENNDG